LNALPWYQRLCLRWVTPRLMGWGKLWFRYNRTCRAVALKGTWGGALAVLFVTIGWGVDMPVTRAAMTYWLGGLGLSVLLLLAWLFLQSWVFRYVPRVSSALGKQAIRQHGWTAQSWELTRWDLVWLRCMPTPEQWALSRSVILDAKLPEVSALPSPSRKRF